MSAPLFITVLVAGAAGAVARFLLAYALARAEAFLPWETLVINAAGSFALGGLTSAPAVSPAILVAVGTGFLGAFTTFSTFAVQTVVLADRGWIRPAANTVAMTVVCVLSAWSGHVIWR